MDEPSASPFRTKQSGLLQNRLRCLFLLVWRIAVFAENPANEAADRRLGGFAKRPVNRHALADVGNQFPRDILQRRLYTYSKQVVSEVIALGRAGSLVDWEDSGQSRAYVVRYSAEQILNWRIQRLGGRNVVDLVVLSEQVPVVNPQDEFEPETVEQIRVLRLEPVEDSSNEYRYVVELWHRVAPQRPHQKTEWLRVERRVPLRLGRPLPLIPFVFHGPRHSMPHVDKLPLADLMAVNLDHYRLDADYKHGLHFTALPTAWVSGFDRTDSLRIGSSTAWVAAAPNATAGYLEFTGQGHATRSRARHSIARRPPINHQLCTTNVVEANLRDVLTTPAP